MKTTTSRRGFTLIELMIALAILALVATLAYRGLSALAASEARLAEESRRWRALDQLFSRLEADLREALPRAARTGDGDEPAWLGTLATDGSAELRFSRAGPEFTAEPGSAGQRIGYRLRATTVEVVYWPRFDQPSLASARAYALATDVAQFRVDYLDARGEWSERWPLPGEAALPRAVRVALRLADGAVIERLLVLR